MADQHSTTTSSTIDPFEALMVVYNPDLDTLTRNLPLQITNTTDDPNSKDILLNAQHNTWIRIFKPTVQDLPTTNKLPVIIYYHGGGFILCSTFWTIYHDYCKSKANTLPAIVLSVEYRLAPECRLPAAYDDAVDALNWVKHQASGGKPSEPWLRDYADFTNCYIMGESAGGNIAYNVSLRASELDLSPVNISGVILNQPFMGGIERTSSELRLINDKILSLPVSDLMWELSLPIGSNRNHPYCNLLINEDDESLRKKCGFIKKCLVIGCDGDPLIDRQVEFVKMLEGKGVKVETFMQEGGYHGMVYFEPKELEIMLPRVKDFILSGASKL
ncbi:hypothetical protein MKW98_006505 [Papaver atlanticum]|uniref:Alpha/beta hydrolase fold-3 domain-containing protein n=1 Tax=Papaver atlanticum TaxID=357466 RepID=A0AAD4XQR4_9MAGN|nr:hypothetical protein MKW98_006505 [Papaver atlanticum]